MIADPKPAARIVDRKVFARFHATPRRCLCCGTSDGINAAHLLGKGRGGDDVIENLIALCGSGSSRCHGAFDNGHAYEGVGFRITQAIVQLAVAEFVRSPDGWYHYRYLIGKLGDGGAEEFLRRLEGETT